jgi:LmbE family N-acetylglucosaminyl deacetylase
MSSSIGGRAFDTSAIGADDAHWDTWARTARRWSPVHGPLVIVAPHPDDETLGAGGLIYASIANRIPVTVISVTNGEAACPEIPVLGSVRRGELIGALSELGLAEVNAIALELPDGKVRDYEDRLAQLVTELVPAGATLVGPFELDGHPDHESAGRACRIAARRCGAVFAQYPIWAWHRGSDELRSEPCATRFLLSAQARSAKQRALTHFRSQFSERPGGAIVPAHVLRYFRRPYEVFLL